MDNLAFTVRAQPNGDKPAMLLTGQPGIGKSTIVQAVIERLGEAALPSLALVAVGLVPVILLSRTLRSRN